MNDLDTKVLNATERLELAVKKSVEAADRLLKCAESISNPTYSVVMDGRELEIQMVRHFSGQKNIVVKNPFSLLDPRLKKALEKHVDSDIDIKGIVYVHE